MFALIIILVIFLYSIINYNNNKINKFYKNVKEGNNFLTDNRKRSLWINIKRLTFKKKRFNRKRRQAKMQKINMPTNFNKAMKKLFT